jgi:hypothetical protein
MDTRKFSKLQETAVAKALSGKRQPNSGATKFAKGDVVLETFLIECKTCTAPTQSFAIRREWIEKNRREAMAIGKRFQAIAFNFGPKQENFYIIDEGTLQELLGGLMED